jgi:quinolinate synthase
MKRITLQAILHALETMTHEVTIDPVIGLRARAPIDRMLAIR